MFDYKGFAAICRSHHNGRLVRFAAQLAGVCSLVCGQVHCKSRRPTVLGLPCLSDKQQFSHIQTCFDGFAFGQELDYV